MVCSLLFIHWGGHFKTIAKNVCFFTDAQKFKEKFDAARDDAPESEESEEANGEKGKSEHLALVAPSRYVNQCWLTNWVMWHLPLGSFTANAQCCG